MPQQDRTAHHLAAAVQLHNSQQTAHGTQGMQQAEKNHKPHLCRLEVLRPQHALLQHRAQHRRRAAVQAVRHAGDRLGHQRAGGVHPLVCGPRHRLGERCLDADADGGAGGLPAGAWA